MSVGALTEHNQQAAYVQAKQVSQNVQTTSEETDRNVTNHLNDKTAEIGDQTRATSVVSRSDTGRVDLYV